MSLHMTKVLRASALALGLALAAFSLTGPAVAAESFTFDKSHTQIRFSWNHLGLSYQSAYFTEYEGTLMIDEQDPSKSSIEVTIDPASVYTGVPPFNDHLKSADFFDVAMFDEITFKTTNVVQTGPKTARMTGDLTIKGITKPVSFDVELNAAGPHPLGAFNERLKNVYAMGFRATARVLRSDFELGRSAPLVSDTIDIEINTELHRPLS